MTNFHFFFLILLVSPRARSIFLKIKKFQSNRIITYRDTVSTDFKNTISRKTRLKFHASAEWPDVTHAFAATQMPTTSEILRISKNPFKHAFLKC